MTLLVIKPIYVFLVKLESVIIAKPLPMLLFMFIFEGKILITTDNCAIYLLFSPPPISCWNSLESAMLVKTLTEKWWLNWLMMKPAWSLFCVVAWFAAITIYLTFNQNVQMGITEDSLENRDMFSNPYQLTSKQLELFFESRERLYAKRRRRISKFCTIFKSGYKSTDNTPLFQVISEKFIYVPSFKAAYCQIPKVHKYLVCIFNGIVSESGQVSWLQVASSTWCSHFKSLANVTEHEKDLWKEALQIFAPKLWPLPSNTTAANIVETFRTDGITSIVIVRHPFTRLASVYFQKVIELSQKDPSWKKFNQNLIDYYRNGSNKATLRPTVESVMPFPGDDPKYAT